MQQVVWTFLPTSLQITNSPCANNELTMRAQRRACRKEKKPKDTSRAPTISDIIPRDNFLREHQVESWKHLLPHMSTGDFFWRHLGGINRTEIISGESVANSHRFIGVCVYRESVDVRHHSSETFRRRRSIRYVCAVRSDV